MKNSEDSIEKVMAGLRDSEPPSGMELRIFTAVQKRASERYKASWWQRTSTGMSWRLRGSLLQSGAVLAAIVIVLSARFYRSGEKSPLSSITTSPRNLTAAHPAESSFPTASATPEAEIKRPALITTTPHQSIHVQRVQSIRAEDSLALREMMAPSHPAPPMPLTKEEKLLLRVVHKGDPAELAMLDPEVRARLIADSRAEFQKFFEPATTREAQ
jgi:hypothetical protein